MTAGIEQNRVAFWMTRNPQTSQKIFVRNIYISIIYKNIILAIVNISLLHELKIPLTVIKFL